MTKLTLFLFILLLLIIASLGYIFVIKNLIVSTNSPAPAPLPTEEQLSPSPTVTSESFCAPNDLQSQVSFEGAAGSMYGTFTIKNISQTPCSIIGNNKITVTTPAKNISLNYEGTATTSFTLQPHQIIYGQVHYPNGPQCSGSIITSPISFSYRISSGSIINFTTTEPGNAMMTTCTAPDEPTEIDLWNLSTTPFH